MSRGLMFNFWKKRGVRSGFQLESLDEQIKTDVMKSKIFTFLVFGDSKINEKIFCGANIQQLLVISMFAFSCSFYCQLQKS